MAVAKEKAKAKAEAKVEEKDVEKELENEIEKDGKKAESKKTVKYEVNGNPYMLISHGRYAIQFIKGIYKTSDTEEIEFLDNYDENIVRRAK